MAGHIAISYELADGIATLDLSGEIDLAAAPQLAGVLAACLDDPEVSAVVVRLSDVTFIDSTGLTVLIHTKSSIEAAGKTFQAGGAQGPVLRVFELTGLAPWLLRDALQPAEPSAPID